MVEGRVRLLHLKSIRRNSMSFVIKRYDLFYVGCTLDDVDGSVEELIYSTNIKNAQKFKTLDEINDVTDLHNIQGYSVGLDK
jgi:hypothetical protein